MKLFNTLSRRVEQFRPLHGKNVHLYSCGPTVYDHIHIGNLSAFITADVLYRTLAASGYKVKHVMNFTDVDDKTIRRSQEQYPDSEPLDALQTLTDHYGEIFISDMQAIGNDITHIEFVKATEHIATMQKRIRELYKAGFAYLADDGVYFSIENYRNAGKTYGQLTEITAQRTSHARIRNDEYDKDNIHDFALWKLQTANEPAWEFELDGHKLLGRPGWHIECSAMSSQALGQPFDIHTGGVDLIFPHHENEIAQSTAGMADPLYAKYFVHNEHLLVDGRKMSKSLNNFYTLRDIVEKGYDPLAFRLLVLQGHYRKQLNFTWESLEAAQNRLRDLHAIADLKHQANYETWVPNEQKSQTYEGMISGLLKELEDDLDTPSALSFLSSYVHHIESRGYNKQHFQIFLEQLDNVLGLGLATRPDIAEEQKHLLAQRDNMRHTSNWTESDKLREQLAVQGIAVRDTPHGQVWSRT